MKTPSLLVALAFPMVSGLALAAGQHSADSEFAMKAAQGSLAEVSMGGLAVNKGAAGDIRQFGQRMVDDHTKANNELKTAAMKSGVDLPTSPSEKQKQAAAKLEKMDGANFDRHYAQMMVKDHEEDVALFRKEAHSGTDPQLKEFAAKTLPVLEEHLKMARALGHAGKTDHEKHAEGAMSDGHSTHPAGHR